MEINYTKIFKTVKVALGMEKFAETLTLKDGSAIEVEVFEVGQAVNKMDGENKIVLEDGEYELENGTKFIIATGLISEIIPKAEMAEEVVVEEKPIAQDEEMINRVAALETKITEIENVITELVNIVSKLAEGQTEMTSNLEKQKSEMTRIVEIVDKEPATKATFSKDDKPQSELDRKLAILTKLRK